MAITLVPMTINPLVFRKAASSKELEAGHCGCCTAIGRSTATPAHASGYKLFLVTRFGGEGRDLGNFWWDIPSWTNPRDIFARQLALLLCYEMAKDFRRANRKRQAARDVTRAKRRNERLSRRLSAVDAYRGALS